MPSKIETERITYSIGEVHQMTGLSKGFLRLEIARGNLNAIKRGRRVLIHKTEFERYLVIGEATVRLIPTGDVRQ